MATVQIAADSGTILREDGLAVRGGKVYPRVEPTPPAPDRDYVSPPRVVEREEIVRVPDRTDEDRDYVDRRYEDRDRRYDERDDRVNEHGHERIRDVPSLFRRAGQHFERRGEQIRNFFLGDSDR